MMRNKYHNQIDVSSAQAPERVIVFFGEEDRVMLILSDILQIMAQNQAVRPGLVELRAMIHSSQAGAIIVSLCIVFDKLSLNLHFFRGKAVIG